MKNMRNTIYAALLAVMMTGCADFLHVNPKGEVFDADMLTTAEGYEDALYGIYAELGSDNNLYSDKLTWLPEIMGVNYSSSDHGYNNMLNAEWEAFGVPQ